MNACKHCLAATAATLIAAAPMAQADPIPLSHLIATRAPMMAGDTRIVFSSFDSSIFDAANVMVSIVDRGELGQGFRIEHDFRDAAPGNESPSDFTLLFEATAMNGARIYGDRVAMEAAADREFSYVHLNDHAFNGEPLISRALSVHANEGGTPQMVESMHDYGPAGQDRLGLAQDGWFFAMAGGSASASFIERTFMTTGVPLPSAATLGLAGLALVAGRRTRR